MTVAVKPKTHAKYNKITTQLYNKYYYYVFCFRKLNVNRQTLRKPSSQNVPMRGKSLLKMRLRERKQDLKVLVITCILLVPKIISLCYQYRARPAGTSMQSDQALYC